jgi:tetratricopeptide (TPR) repeat protein
VAEWVIATLTGEHDAAAVVNELAEKSLLTPAGVDGAGQARYRLHDLIGEYARERLAEDPPAEQQAALRRALDGWLQLAGLASKGIASNPFLPVVQDEAAPVIPDAQAHLLVADPLTWFTTERLNLLEAVRRAKAAGWPELAIRLAMRQTDFQYLQDRTDEAIAMWGDLVSVDARSASGTAVATAKIRYAAALKDRGLTADAVSLFERSIAEFEEAGDLAGLAFALYWRASCAWDLGQPGEARRYGERGLELARQTGSRHAEFLNLRLVGQSLAAIGRAAEGIEACEQAVGLATELGDESYDVAGWHTLGNACVIAGRFDRAVVFGGKLLELSRRLANVRGEALALGLLGDAYRGQRRYSEAVEALSAALSIFRDHANRRHQGMCLLKLGYACQGMGQYQQAAGYLKDSLQIFRELRLPSNEEQARQALAQCQFAGAG